MFVFAHSVGTKIHNFFFLIIFYSILFLSAYVFYIFCGHWWITEQAYGPLHLCDVSINITVWWVKRPSEKQTNMKNRDGSWHPSQGEEFSPLLKSGQHILHINTQIQVTGLHWKLYKQVLPWREKHCAEIAPVSIIFLYY